MAYNWQSDEEENGKLFEIPSSDDEEFEEFEDYKNEPIEYKNEPIEYKNEPIEYKNEPIEYKNEPIEYKNEPIEYKNEEFEEYKDEEFEDYNQSANFRNESRDNLGTPEYDIDDPELELALKLSYEQFNQEVEEKRVMEEIQAEYDRCLREEQDLEYARALEIDRKKEEEFVELTERQQKERLEEMIKEKDEEYLEAEERFFKERKIVKPIKVCLKFANGHRYPTVFDGSDTLKTVGRYVKAIHRVSYCQLRIPSVIVNDSTTLLEIGSGVVIFVE